MIQRSVTFDQEKLKMYSYEKTIHYFPHFETLDFKTGKTVFKVLKGDVYYRFNVYVDCYQYVLTLKFLCKRSVSMVFSSYSLTHLFEDVYDFIFC